MKLIVGLGNPGPKYARNRHNVGFMALERIADYANLGSWRTRFHSLACDGELGGERILLLKPQTYYNDTGNAVREAAKFLKIKVNNIIVFHDEIDLAPGKLRVKIGGGLAGNNGLRSMQAQLSSPEFTRVRIGVGHPGDKNQVANYVLKDIPKADLEWLDVMLDAIARSAHRLAVGETERFQTDVAQVMSELRGDTTDRNSTTKSTPEPQSGANRATPPRRSAAKQPNRSGSGSGTGSGAAKRSSRPSQLDLARMASSKRQKPSRKIKKGIHADTPETDESTAPSQNNETPEIAPANPLAAKLKRWFSKSSDKN